MRFDSVGIAPVAYVTEIKSQAIENMIAAYRNDIVLPGVTVVGREESKTHEIVTLDADGRPLDHEALVAFCKANPPTFDADGKPVYPVLRRAEDFNLKAADDHLPKNYRIVKAKELDLKLYEPS